MPDNTVTPGWKTSEFWLHIVVQIPSVLGIFLGASNPVVLGVAAIGALGSAVYTAYRSNVKMTAICTGVMPQATDFLNQASKTIVESTKA